MVPLAVIAWPAWQVAWMTTTVTAAKKRFVPWVNGSMVLLWVTGFVQMTNDANYNGFLSIDSTWAAAMLLKHVAVVAMMAATLYLQFASIRRWGGSNCWPRREAAVSYEEHTRLQFPERHGSGSTWFVCGYHFVFTAIATAV